MKVYCLIAAASMSMALPATAQIYADQPNTHTSAVNATHASDGFNAINQYTTIGGTTYGSDGSSQAIAGTTYHSNGTIYKNIGTITNGSDQSITGMTTNGIKASYTNIGGNNHTTSSTNHTNIGGTSSMTNINMNAGTSAYDYSNILCKNNTAASDCN